MDSSLYKDIAVSRGLSYRYWFSPAAAGKPTVLLIHGFPSTTRDWRHVIPHFTQKGHGVLAFDMLGFGHTDKPTDPAAYVSSLLTKDVIDILDAEKLDKVVVSGYDWYVSVYVSFRICRVTYSH